MFEIIQQKIYSIYEDEQERSNIKQISQIFIKQLILSWVSSKIFS